jgi:hypothetical protein
MRVDAAQWAAGIAPIIRCVSQYVASQNEYFSCFFGVCFCLPNFFCKFITIEGIQHHIFFVF